MTEPTVGVVSYISTGNIITILIFVIGMIINIAVSTAKMTKFITMTEMKFQAGEKKFTQYDNDIENLDKRCDHCSKSEVLGDRILQVEKENKIMHDNQVSIRASWPPRFETIESDIGEIKSDVRQIKDKLFIGQ